MIDINYSIQTYWIKLYGKTYIYSSVITHSLWHLHKYCQELCDWYSTCLHKVIEVIKCKYIQKYFSPSNILFIFTKLKRFLSILITYDLWVKIFSKLWSFKNNFFFCFNTKLFIKIFLYQTRVYVQWWLCKLSLFTR